MSHSLLNNASKCVAWIRLQIYVDVNPIYEYTKHTPFDEDKLNMNIYIDSTHLWNMFGLSKT